MDIYLDKIGKTVFTKQNDMLLPLGFNLDEDTNNFELINSKPYLRDFVEFVIRARRDLDPVSKRIRNRSLYPYQWSSAIYPIISTIEQLGHKFLNAFARQAGKSEGIKLWLPFLVVFGRQYIEDFKHTRFTAVLGSYKQIAINKLTNEVKPQIEKAIEVFNEMHPDTPLVSGNTSKGNDLKDNMDHMEINIIIEGQSLPYSEIYFVTMATKQDGLASYITVIDEAGMVDKAKFDESVAPFSNTTAGTQVIIGVPNHNPVSLLAQTYSNPQANKLLYTWKDCYRYMKWVNEKHANIYKKGCENEIASQGEFSATIQWNYWVNFDASTGKFMTDDILNRENIMSLRLGNMALDQKLSGTSIYRAGSADISPKSDYFSISLGVITVDKSEDNPYDYKTYLDVHDMITYNSDKNKERLDIDQKVEKLLDIIKRNKLDYFIIDSTSHQKHFVQKLFKGVRTRGYPTIILPYDYSKASKLAMFNQLEDDFYAHTTKLLEKDLKWETEKLYEEMMYFEKLNKNNELSYCAPNKTGYTDDHMNSIALLNRTYNYLVESMMARKNFDDGANMWAPRLVHWEDYENNLKTPEDEEEYVLNLITGFTRVRRV